LDPDDLSENRKQIAASSQVLSCRSHGRRHKLIMLLSKFLKDQSGATDCDEKSSRLAPGERSLFEAIGNASSSTIPARDVAIVVAHPDDESIGCGAQLARLQGRTVFVVTDGAPLDPCFAGWHGFPSIEAYAQARRREIRTAL